MDALILFVGILIGLSAVALFQVRAVKRRQREEDQVLKSYFLKGLAGLLSKVAMADGHMTGREVEMTGRLFGKMGLTESEKAICTGYFIEACQDGMTARDHANRFIAYADTVASEFLYDMLWRLSRIDGVVDPAEDALLEQIATYLGLSRKIYENFKAGKKPTHCYAALKAAGVPPSLLALVH